MLPCHQPTTNRYKDPRIPETDEDKMVFVERTNHDLDSAHRHRTNWHRQRLDTEEARREWGKGAARGNEGGCHGLFSRQFTSDRYAPLRLGDDALKMRKQSTECLPACSFILPREGRREMGVGVKVEVYFAEGSRGYAGCTLVDVTAEGI